jgi:hypothetical protein
MFAIFDNLETFNSWHQSIKLKLNYPLYGSNVLTGEIDYENPTTEYTQAKINSNDSRVIAWVGDETVGLSLIDIDDETYKNWHMRYPKPDIGNWIWNDATLSWVEAE